MKTQKEYFQHLVHYHNKLSEDQDLRKEATTQLRRLPAELQLQITQLAVHSPFGESQKTFGELLDTELTVEYSFWHWRHDFMHTLLAYE